MCPGIVDDRRNTSAPPGTIDCKPSTGNLEGLRSTSFSGLQSKVKGSRTPNNWVSGAKYYNVVGIWDLKSYYLGPWTLRVRYGRVHAFQSCMSCLLHFHPHHRFTIKGLLPRACAPGTNGPGLVYGHVWELSRHHMGTWTPQ